MQESEKMVFSGNCNYLLKAKKDEFFQLTNEMLSEKKFCLNTQTQHTNLVPKLFLWSFCFYCFTGAV